MSKSYRIEGSGAGGSYNSLSTALEAFPARGRRIVSEGRVLFRAVTHCDAQSWEFVPPGEIASPMRQLVTPADPVGEWSEVPGGVL
jgi:hypothetical protein